MQPIFVLNHDRCRNDLQRACRLIIFCAQFMFTARSKIRNVYLTEQLHILLNHTAVKDIKEHLPTVNVSTTLLYSD